MTTTYKKIDVEELLTTLPLKTKVDLLAGKGKLLHFDLLVVFAGSAGGLYRQLEGEDTSSYCCSHAAGDVFAGTEQLPTSAGTSADPLPLSYLDIDAIN